MEPSVKKTKKKGDRQRRRKHVLLDPEARAFRGWQEVRGPWTLTTCKSFVEWCHIDKLFPYHRHTNHIRNNLANLHYCKDDAFVQRCIEVYRALYGSFKIPRSEVSLGIAQMVYAELKLGVTVDWRTMKTSKRAQKPTSRDIPKAGPSNNPRDGLGPRKNIVQGVADDAYTWSDASSAEDLGEEVTARPTHVSEDTAVDEDLPLVVSNPERAIVLYVEPLRTLEALVVHPPDNDEVMENVEAHFEEIEVSPRTMPLPLGVEPTEDPEPMEEDAPQEMNRQLKKHYKAKLERLLKELNEKQEECQVLERESAQELNHHDFDTLQALIETGKIRVSKQQGEIEALEDFFLKFDKGQDGGSSSKGNPALGKNLQALMDKCRVEEFKWNREKQAVRDGRSKLTHLEELKDKDPLHQCLNADESLVDYGLEISMMDVEDLKKKLATLKKLEQKIEEKMEHQKAHVSLMTLFKKFWVETNIQKNQINNLEREQRIVRANLEEANRRMEREENM